MNRLTLDEFSIRFLSAIFESVKKDCGAMNEDELIAKVENKLNESYRNYVGTNNEYN